MLLAFLLLTEIVLPSPASAKPRAVSTPPISLALSPAVAEARDAFLRSCRG